MRRVHAEQGARGRPAAVPANRSSARAKHSCRAHSRDNPAAQGPPSRRVHTQATPCGQERAKRGEQERQRCSHDGRASQPSQGHASTRVLTGAGGPGACHRAIPIKTLKRRPSVFVSLIAAAASSRPATFWRETLLDSAGTVVNLSLHTEPWQGGLLFHQGQRCMRMTRGRASDGCRQTRSLASACPRTRCRASAGSVQ